LSFEFKGKTFEAKEKPFVVRRRTYVSEVAKGMNKGHKELLSAVNK